MNYNQGPVSNPSLISPGKIVGYTPAGQRYEVDLNAHRPKWFNSEYARMQFDDATIINATRMMHELETGHFLPDTLDPVVELQYYYQNARAKIGALTFVEETLATDLSNDTLEHKIRIIEAETRLIEIVKFAAIKINDFPAELNVMIQAAMQTDINVLTLKKYPIIVYTIDKLAKQCQHLDVAKSAQAFFNKIKKLFNASDSGSLFEHLKCEAQKLNEECKDKTLFDLIYMTDKAKDEIETNCFDNKTSAHLPENLQVEGSIAGNKTLGCPLKNVKVESCNTDHSASGWPLENLKVEVDTDSDTHDAPDYSLKDIKVEPDSRNYCTNDQAFEAKAKCGNAADSLIGQEIKESEASKTEANPPNSLNCQDPKAKSENHNNAQDPTDGQEFVTDTAPILTNRRVAQAAVAADHHSVN